MSAAVALKNGTWDVHLRMEKRLSIKERFADLATYGNHIAQLWAFYAPAEAAWGTLLEQALTDFPSRRKAALLADDLQAIGRDGKILSADVPLFSDIASALGGFYVLEGATLGGQHLLPMAEHMLGLSAGHGASYFASYGPRVGEMWRLFGATVATHCQTPETTERAVAAARATFLALEEWLCGAPE